MIVTFKSKASGDIVYTADVALKLLNMMGRDDKVPSALYAEDVALALEALRAALAQYVARQQPESAIDDDIHQDAAQKRSIALTVRAQPLLQLLEKAAKKHCPVLWQ
ncbi:DUF1840 family protein [Rheinheimera fenheensis]|uniref:DUF1840 family protein n=1 Tax=Rheinheimera fenheensis TaxID=3152295 RepID=UPI00325C9380